MAEHLSALEYLRAEAEHLMTEEPGDGAAMVSLALAAFEAAVRKMSDLFDPLGTLTPDDLYAADRVAPVNSLPGSLGEKPGKP